MHKVWKCTADEVKKQHVHVCLETVYNSLQLHFPKQKTHYLSIYTFNYTNRPYKFLSSTDSVSFSINPSTCETSDKLVLNTGKSAASTQVVWW